MSQLKFKWMQEKISKAVTFFTRHDITTFAAAISFYTSLSLAPLLVITLASVNLISPTYQNQFLAQVQNLLGHQAADAIALILQSANSKPQLGTLAGILGIFALLFSASGVFTQLQSSLNVIFESPVQTSSEVSNWIRNRLLSIGMVLSIGFLSMVSLLVSAVLSFLFTQKGSYWSVANEVATLAIFALLFSFLFKYLPDSHLDWKRALKGGLITALLFTVGKSLIGIYLGRSAVGSAYGAAGSLVVLLAWVYYSAIIFLTGAELTNTFKKSE